MQFHLTIHMIYEHIFPNRCIIVINSAAHILSIIIRIYIQLYKFNNILN